MERVPRIKSVQVSGRSQLLVLFENGVLKEYDCEPILSRPEFYLLTDPAFFRTVQVDPGGYGISWNDYIDLSEYEMWTEGKSIANKSLQQAAGQARGLP